MVQSQKKPSQSCRHTPWWRHDSSVQVVLGPGPAAAAGVRGGRRVCLRLIDRFTIVCLLHLYSFNFPVHLLRHLKPEKQLVLCYSPSQLKGNHRIIFHHTPSNLRTSKGKGKTTTRRREALKRNPAEGSLLLRMANMWQKGSHIMVAFE